MRWLGNLAAAAVMGIALYFAVCWAGEALRVFTSPTYGLDEFAESQEVFGIGRALALHGSGLFRAAAFLGAFRLVGALAFALYAAGRVRAFLLGKPCAYEMLEAALTLVVLLSFVTLLAAVLEESGSLLRANGLQLLLAAAAAIFNIIEREARAAPSPATAGTGALQASAGRGRRLLQSIPLRALWRLAPVRAVAAALDAFVRRWSDDLGAPVAGEPRHPA